MNDKTRTTTALPPVTKSIRLTVPPEQAFRVFTRELGAWWPLKHHSVSGERAVTCGLEPRLGGALFEEESDGQRHVWGRIHVWEPPRRLVFSWHPGRSETSAQEVELRFDPEATGTLVKLEHRGWERLAEGAEETRRSYETGWDGVLESYARQCRP